MIKSVFGVLNKNGGLTIDNPWSIKDFEGYDIPILYLSGSISGMTKDDKVTLDYIWKEFSGTCTLKWQGQTSVITFQDNKNYTIKFDQEFEVVDGWGEQSKYCLKSNFNDPSQYRNLLCANLWAKIVKTRTPTNAYLNACPNYGAVDGFPIIVSLNGEFHGLYTFNIPKDEWTFNMTDSSVQQAIVQAEYTNDPCKFKALADFSYDFSLEYSSDDQSDWVLTSLNRLIEAVMNSDGTNIEYGISPYLDWDSAIDYYIHTVLTKNTDATNKNYILVSYDGVKWVFSAYDMDTTFGVTNYGSAFTNASGTPNFATMAESNKLFWLIWTYMRPQLRARYNEIRENVTNEINVATLCYNFAAKMPLPIVNANAVRNKRIAASSASTIDQILTWLRLRLPLADEWIQSTNGELDMPEQVAPDGTVTYTNLVPTSIDTDGSIYNGTGYKDNVRLSSSGSVSGTAQTGSVVTGFIPFTNTDVIRIKGAKWRNMTEEQGGHWYIAFYNSNKTLLIAVADSAYESTYATSVSVTYDESTGVTTFDITDDSFQTNTAYFRINAYGNGADLIVTVNEEIA